MLRSLAFVSQRMIGLCMGLAFAGGLLAQDFTVSAAPTSFGVVSPGMVLTSTITTTVSGGFDYGISLTATPTPYATIVFSPGTIAKPGAGTSTMTITLGAGIGAGNYNLTITASGGPTSNPISHTTAVTFTVPGIAYTVMGKLGPVLSGKDPLGFGKVTYFVGTTGIQPADIASNPGNTASYSNLGVLVASALSLDCTGAAATAVVGDNSVGGDDSFSIGNCAIAGVAPFTARFAFPATTFPSPIPLPFATANLDNTNTGAVNQYSQVSYTFANETTALGVSGTISAECLACSTISANPASLAFSASAGGGVPPAQNITVTTSGAQTDFAVTTSTTSGGNWLSASSSFGQTGTSIAVSVNPGTLSAGSYSGVVTLYAAASNAPLKVNVTLNVSGAPFSISANPASLAFNWVTGATAPSQPLAITASNGLAFPFTVSAVTTDGNPWLTANPASGTTGGSSLTVTADPSKLPSGGNYSGSLTITASGATNSPLQVPVTFAATQVQAAPQSLTFSMNPGGPNPASQQLSVNSTAGLPGVPYTVSVSTVAGGSWLAVSPAAGVSNGNPLSISINGAALAAGVYQGTVSITPSGASTSINAAVLLLVGPPPLTVSPSSLSFLSSGGGVPAAQQITVTAPGPSLAYVVSATTNTGGAWLLASAGSGTTPGTAQVSVDPTVLSGLATGDYSGQVIFTATASNSPLSVPVTLKVTVGARNVIYQSAGMLATPAVSGSDFLELAGEPFSMSLVANKADKPVKHGGHWSLYSGLTLQGVLHSHFSPHPFRISSKHATLMLSVANPAYDEFRIASPAAVEGNKITLSLDVHLLKGTLTGSHIDPFTAPVTLTNNPSANAILSYTNTAGTVTLAVASGTLTGTVGPPAPTSRPVMLHAQAAEAAATSAQGTRLKMYASGVTDAAQIRIWIAGEEAIVRSVRASDDYPGLDEITVEVTRQVARRSPVDAAMTVDGQVAPLVRLALK